MKAFIEHLLSMLTVGTVGLAKRFLNELAMLGAGVSQNKTVAPYVSSYNVSVVGASIVTPINEESYPEGEHFYVTAIRLHDGAGADLKKIAWTPGVSDAITSAGKMNITNNGTTVLKDWPLTTFQPGDFAEAGIIQLAKPILIKAQTELSVSIKFEEAPTTANQALRVELWGMKLI